VYILIGHGTSKQSKVKFKAVGAKWEVALETPET
jgi:hypothetical protein